MHSNTKLREKLNRGESLRILFLNDLGFQYGAGIAHFRQIQSFLLMGHDVKGICWIQGLEEGDLPLNTRRTVGNWLGMLELPHAHATYGCKDEDIIQIIIREIHLIEPDVIIVGNLHGAKWPLQLLLALRGINALVIAYMHDCYLISGRCAYPSRCRLYETGCDDRCPTAHEYPVLNPSEIADAWRLRRAIFCGSTGISIAANSYWTLKMANLAFKDLRHAEVVYLGLDERLFSPINKKLVRELLGLPDDRLIILGGSVNVSDRRKGGYIFREVVKRLSKRAIFIVFGAETLQMEGVRAAGLVRDFRKMPLIFNAADIFLGTSLEEAFGQTLCEASACALPIVAFNVDGIPEVARHNVNARLVNEIATSGLLSEIDFLANNPDERTKYGLAGRSIIAREFSLKRQGERWMEYLNKAVALDN